MHAISITAFSCTRGGRGCSSLSQLSSAESVAFPRTTRQFIIGRQRQTTIHTLTRTYGQFRVPSWPHVLECEDGSQSIWERTAKIRNKNSTQDHPRQRNLTRNLSCCEATPLTLSCNKSFHNKSRASPWIKRTLGNLKRRRVAR